MSLKSTLIAASVAFAFALPVLADGIEIHDSYARSTGAMAQAGAAFMVIHNSGDTDDRLIAASSDAAVRVELHTHIEDDNGVMQMREVEAGFRVPAGGDHALQRGGDHVMFMGLTGPFVEGEMITVTLTFEQSGEVTVQIPVDLERMPMMMETMGSDLDHSDMDMKNDSN